MHKKVYLMSGTHYIAPVNYVNPMLACERCRVVMSLRDREFLVVCSFKSLQEYVKYLNGFLVDVESSTPYPYVYVMHVFLDKESKTIYVVIYGKFVRTIALTTGLNMPLELDPLYVTLVLTYMRLKKIGLPVKEPRGVNVKEMYEAYMNGKIAEYYARVLGVPVHVINSFTAELFVDTIEPPDPLFFDFIRKIGYILGVKEFIDYAENRSYETAKRFEEARTRINRIEVEGYEKVAEEVKKALDMYREQVESVLNRYRESAGTGKPPTII